MKSALLVELESYFAPTVGAERSTEILRSAANELGWILETIDDARADAILKRLTLYPGIVGVTARFATQRRARNAAASGAFSVATGSEVPASTSEAVEITALEQLLGASMDAAKARTIVAEYWRDDGLTGTRCTKRQALALLDRMAGAGGAVGVAATFAKARWHLRRA